MVASQYRRRNRMLWAEVEATPGTDPTPTIADVVFSENPVWDPNLNSINTGEATFSIDTPAATPAGGSRNVSCRTYFRGSGTAGQAPDIDRLLRGATLGVRTVAAPITGTATAGTANTVTLPVAFSNVLNFHKGFIISTTAGTGTGQTRMVTGNTTGRVYSVTPDWTTPPDATTTVVLHSGVRYAAQSSLLETVAFYGWERRSDAGLAKRTRVLGCSGTVRMAIAVAAACSQDWSFQGKLEDSTDITDPGTPAFQNRRNIPFLAANCFVDGDQIKLNNFTLDTNNDIQLEQDPADAFGIDTAVVVARAIGGTFQVPRQLEAVFAPLPAWRDSVDHQLAIWWGQVAGNRCAVLLDGLRFTGVGDSDVRGSSYENITYGVGTPDDSLYLLFW